MPYSSVDNPSKIIEQAVDQIEEIAQQAKRALRSVSSSSRDLRESGGEEAWAVARRARDQAGEFAGTLYSRGQRAADVVGHQVSEQPVIALVVAGALGFLLGYMLRSSR